MEQKKLVMVVEDELSLARAIEEILVREPRLQVMIAKDGEEGFKMIEEYRPDLVLLDIILPKMDGLLMLAKVREKEWGKALPVIVLTNLSMIEKEEEAKRLGVKEFIVKTDLTLEEVTQKVKKELGL